MFGFFRIALRSFVLGVVAGMLLAPRPGAETRRMLNARFARWLDRVLEMAELPPVPPERARTNGHAERPTAKRPRTSTDAPAS